METVWLQRPNSDVPWGFRLHGGRDYSQPLTVQRVTPGSIAATGLKQGDVVLKIGDLETKYLTHQQAQNQIKTCANLLQLYISKGGSYQPQTAQSPYTTVTSGQDNYQYRGHNINDMYSQSPSGYDIGSATRYQTDPYPPYQQSPGGVMHSPSHGTADYRSGPESQFSQMSLSDPNSPYQSSPTYPYKPTSYNEPSSPYQAHTQQPTYAPPQQQHSNYPFSHQPPTQPYHSPPPVQPQYQSPSSYNPYLPQPDTQYGYNTGTQSSHAYSPPASTNYEPPYSYRPQAASQQSSSAAYPYTPQTQPTSSEHSNYDSGVSSTSSVSSLASNPSPPSPNHPQIPDQILNTMAKTDKKPFSYTPDLNEIKQQREKVKKRHDIMPKYQQMLNLPKFDDTPPRKPKPSGGPGSAVLSQYNSPIDMYSTNNVADAIMGQTAGLVSDVTPIGQSKSSQDITESATYKMIHGIEDKKTPQHAPAPQRMPSTEDKAKGVRSPVREPSKDDELKFSGIHGPSSIPSRSFHVLQRMTSSEQEKQEEEETVGQYEEASIRYKGRNIPSKSFRMLQQMTGGEQQEEVTTSRSPRKISLREESSERQSGDEVEDRRYTGSDIPSRSFKVLQKYVGSDPESQPEVTEELTPVMSNMSDDLARLLFEPKSAKREANENVPFKTSLRSTGTSIASTRRRDFEPTGTYLPPKLKPVENQKENGEEDHKSEEASFIKTLTLKRVQPVRSADDSTDFDAACSDFESTHAEMSNSSIHDQELEKQDSNTSRLEEIEKVLEARRGSVSSLLDDAPEFESLRLRPVQRNESIQTKSEVCHLEQAKLKKVERPEVNLSNDKDLSDNDSEVSTSSSRLEEIERQLAERRGSQPLLDEPPEFEAFTLRKVSTQVSKDDQNTESQAPFDSLKLKHVDTDNVPKENGEGQEGELFDKLRTRQSKTGIIDVSAYSPDKKDTTENKEVEKSSDPDKTVVMAYTGSKIPSRAFSRLRKSISFDSELEDKTIPIEVARRVRARRREQLQQGEDEPSDTTNAPTDKMYVGGKIPSRYFNKLRRSVDRDGGSETDTMNYLSFRRMSEPVNKPEEIEHGYESDTAVCRMYSGQRIPSRSFTRLRRSVERDAPSDNTVSPGRRRRRRERPPEPEPEPEDDINVVDQVIENMYVGSHIPSKYFQMLRKSVDKLYQDDGTEIQDEGTTEF